MRLKEIAVGAVVAVGLFAVIASGSSGDSSSSRGSGVQQGASSAAAGAASGSAAAQPTGAEADVTIAGCEIDATLQSPVAHLTITNNSSKSSNYLVTIAFDSADGATQIDTGIAAANNLLPGQSTSVDANSVKSDVPAGFVCKVADVTRYAA